MAQVDLKQVWKIYPGDVEAVKDANLQIQNGEFMVIVGPSGCGKSTTLRMVAGLEDISRGEISIDGRVVNDVAPKDRDIAMVFQNYALYPHMTVYENMAFGLKMRKYAKAEIDERVREAADILGLEELLERKPKALSGGQRQRVAVGRAIVRKPKVFLFDEPLSNLDAKLRVQMRAEISRLHQRLGATMIYVTHDQVEAMTMGTRICLMKDGLVQQVEEPLKLYREPVNRFVAGFIGSPAMNLLDGTVSGSGADTVFETNGRRVSLPAELAGAVSGPVTLGIRPENLRLVAGSDEGTSFEVHVDLVEPLGSEVYLHGSLGDARVVARLGPEEGVSPGATVHLAADPTKLHFFGGEDGAALNPSLASVD